MRAYTQLAVKTCHRRGAYAIGGMAAQIPIKNDTDANERALAKVVADKGTIELSLFAKSAGEKAASAR